MIKRFIERFENRKSELQVIWSEKHPKDYKEIVTEVVKILKPTEEEQNNKEWNYPNPKRIHLVDDGEYQGTLVFIIACTGYQPDTYWYVKVSYGSCSGCDTLEAIKDWSGEKPSERQTNEYLTLALHVVQNIGAMQSEE